MTPTAQPPESALSTWAFSGVLRSSQQALLDAVHVRPPEPLHLVAPPGAGKTLMGLLLAMRRGSRAVVLAPTTTIAHQWMTQALALAPHPGAVSDDPARIADLTVLTYQRISVPDRSDAFEPMARDLWVTELVDGGQTRPEATALVAALAVENPAAYRSGIARRATRLRRSLVRHSTEELAACLHPNARRLLDDLVDAGVTTVVLDECHHLTDHWALVIAYLRARIAQAGSEPLLVGLTATVPSPQDATGYENYTGLLGEVDYEAPTPAVVREGALAPYRDLAWFTAPTMEEATFLAGRDGLLAALIRNTLGRDEGVVFLLDVLLGDRGAGRQLTRDEIDARISSAYVDDFPMAAAAAAVLRDVAPTNDLLPLLPDESRLIGDDALRLLARFLVQHVLPDPARAEDWARARRTLADFGYALTDRGLRRARDPIESTLATSAAKDRAAADILAQELASAEADRVRAVVVCDFAEHGNRAGRTARRGGALRCFDALVADPRLQQATAILVTARHVRVASRDLSFLLPRLQRVLGTVPQLGVVEGDTTELVVTGVTRARVIAGVSTLIGEGVVRVLVGTRGLLGEGWDCPAVNTLIDLTTASTSAAAQQLRGRTMRLDPGWPEKVAHNWSVVTLLPAARTTGALADVKRLGRKLDALWGVRAENAPDVVRGPSHTLTGAQRGLLTQVREGRAPGDVIARLQKLTPIRSRAETRDRWRLGEPIENIERRMTVVAGVDRALPPAPFRARFSRSLGAASAGGAVLASLTTAASAALLALGTQPGAGFWIGGAAALTTALTVPAGISWWRMRRRVPDDMALWTQTAHAVRDALVADGALSRPHTVRASIVEREVRIVLEGAGSGEQAVFRRSLIGLFERVRTPRFLLEVDRGVVGDPLSRLAMRATRGRGDLLAVPKDLGRRRGTAVAFAQAWNDRVGPAVLHEMNSRDDAALLAVARRQSRTGSPRPFQRDVWS
ncbi:DEAD/DEAH box helicase family protein [Microbacterium sp. GXS0129]|uniref:DEAD/DEAH box helicase family protein n=1 Tax=Microbacterium sp. GXS0129 TaxID=3377836 RepID=UPI00383B0AE2